MEIRSTDQSGNIGGGQYGAGIVQPGYAVSDAQGALLRSVFGWMSIGLIVTALTSFTVINNIQSMPFLLSPGVFFTLILVELGLVGFLSFRVNKMEASTASFLFLAYSALNGITLAPIAFAYTSESLASTFFIAAGTFGGMAFLGAVTKRNLDSLGSFLMMGLFGVILASIVNLFMQSSGLNFVLNVVGILVFVGLTAHDTNKIKRLGGSVTQDTDDFKRVAVIGALTLYLDFINLFIYLLRFLGDRRN